ncbi:MAG: immunoglobulin-like domain-containing protein, partial [Candidatus Izemoplasmatales bacterium]
MKKFVLMMMSFLAIMVVVGCGGKTTEEITTGTPTTGVPTTSVPTDTDPVISGAVNKTIEKNSVFLPKEGITAFDAEDGDITSRIQYSGNVNPMAEGEYNATYTVVDDDGNVDTVTVTITVVYTDTQGPLLAGVGDKTIYVGEVFNALDGVSANDTIDGVVDVTYTGEVNIWAEDDYELVYSASDESDNETTKTRVITVSFGDFVFGDSTTYELADLTLAEEVYSTPALSGGVINDAIANFTYVKVVIDVLASEAGTLNISLGEEVGSVTEIDVTAAQESFTVYYVIDESLTDALFSVDTNGTTLTDLSVDVSFAEVKDLVAPVLSVPTPEIAYIVNYSLDGLEAALRSQVTAVDDIDGNITSLIEIDFASLDLTEAGEYDVIYSVTDAGGNESTYTRTVVVGNVVDSGFLTDPNFQNNGDGQWIEKSNNGEASIAYDATEQTMAVTVTKLGDWLSAAGTYVKQNSSGLEVDQWYMFTFTVKTTIDRKMGFRMGLDTDQENGWIDDFDGRNDLLFDLTADYQTFNFFFKLDSLTSSAGYNDFKIELNLGNNNYSNIGTDGVTTFKDVYMYKVVTEYAPPTYITNQGADLPVKFTVGDDAPNWADYVTFSDMSKNVLTPTIDASDVDMSTPGTYNVLYSATDSRDKTTDYTLTIEVLSVENADEVAPVVTVKDGVPTSVDQFTNLGDISLHQLVDAVDAVDGVITVLPAMVDDGGLNFNIAGVYTVTFSVYDLSGNVNNFTVDVTVVDKEGPKINVNDTSINVGDSYDPLANLTVVDNVDGTIPNTSVTVTGLDAFMDGNIATTEGVFTVTFEVADALGNVSTKTIEVEVINIEWDETTRAELGTPNEGPTHSTVTLDPVEEAYLITEIDINVDPWDHARWVYYFDNLEMGKTYKFEITAKATTATDLYFRIGSTLSVEPWIDDFEGGLKTVSIGTDYVTYQVVFTVNNEMPDGTAKFQFMYGYLPTDAENTIYIKQFDIVQMQDGVEPVFEEVEALLGAEDEGPTHSTVTYNEIDDVYEITDIDINVDPWDHARMVYYFDNLEMDATYRFVITAKATTATDLYFRIGSTLSVEPWIDDFEGGLKTVSIGT